MPRSAMSINSFMCMSNSSGGSPYGEKLNATLAVPSAVGLDLCSS